MPGVSDTWLSRLVSLRPTEREAKPLYTVCTASTPFIYGILNCILTEHPKGFEAVGELNVYSILHSE